MYVSIFISYPPCFQVIIAEGREAKMKRYGEIDPSLPAVTGNIIINSDPPKGNLNFIYFLSLAANDVLGEPLNPTRKPWQVYFNFFKMWGAPSGGTVFSGFSGTGSLEQAMMFLGKWNVISFERDQRMWKHQCEILTNWSTICDKKVSSAQSKVEREQRVRKLFFVMIFFSDRCWN